MPVIRTLHRQRAAFERDMAAVSAGSMARNIHLALAGLHAAAADGRHEVLVPKATFE